MLEQFLKKRVTSIPAVYLVLCRQNAGSGNAKEILMSLRKNTGYRDGFWSLPAGHLEEKESLLQAMIREAKEELHIDIEASNLKLAHSMWRATPEAAGGRLDFFFTSSKWTGGLPVNAEPEKCGQISWWPIDQLPSPLIPEVSHAIDAIQQNISYSEVPSI